MSIHKKESMDKYECKDCFAKIANNSASISRHNKTKKHLISINKLDSLDKDKLEKEKERQKKIRQEASGKDREEFLRIQREKKRAYRARIKAEKTGQIDIKVGDKKDDKDLDKKDNKKDLSDDEDICNDILAKVKSVTQNFDIPKQEVKKIVKEKIIKHKIEIKVNQNIEELLDDMDKQYLTKKNSGQVNRDSLIKYIDKIRTTYTNMNDGKTWSGSIDFLKNTKKVISYLEKEYSNENTLKTYFTAIVGILNRLKGFDDTVKPYQKKMNFYLKESTKKNDKNELTPAQKKNYMNWQQILDFKNPDWSDEDQLLYDLYTCLPPRRLEAWLRLKYVKLKKMNKMTHLDKNYNYLIANKNGNIQKLLLFKYKTHKKYGRVSIDLRQQNELPIFNYKKLLKSAETFVKSTNIKSDELCFPDTKGKVYGDMNYRLSYVFKKTGKNISVNILRHAFISHYVNKKNITMGTLKKLARSLGHSIMTMLSYRKFSSEKEKEKLEKEAQKIDEEYDLYSDEEDE